MYQRVIILILVRCGDSFSRGGGVIGGDFSYHQVNIVRGQACLDRERHPVHSGRRHEGKKMKVVVQNSFPRKVPRKETKLWICDS